MDTSGVKAYIVPDWLTVIGGLVIFRRRPKPRVLLGLRSPERAEPNKWCLPTGLGAIRRDISSALAAKAPDSLVDPMAVIQLMSRRHQLAFQSPPGFAMAETQWYVQIPSNVGIEQLVPLKPICQLDDKGLLVKAYFGLEWQYDEPPKPAETEWPFQEVRFFSQKELGEVPVAFGCDQDLEAVFWPMFS